MNRMTSMESARDFDARVAENVHGSGWKDPTRLQIVMDADYCESFEPGDNPLAAERAGLGLAFPHVQRLANAGVRPSTIAELTATNDLLLGRVDLLRGEMFQIGGPDPRLILGVRDVAGSLIDLVAMSTHVEDEWALRLGHADMLGEWHYYRAIACELRQIRLYSTPMAWLRGGCDGICILDWNRSALSALRGLGTKVTIDVDPGAALRLKGVLKYGDLPLVRETRPQAMETA